jgi:AcrR family transcriptional regulator
MNKSPRRAPASAASRGRRRGSPDTREQILEVARRRFLAEGFGPVTMRSIAAEAGVDAALLSYFFGSKQGLVSAALALSANPADLLATALPGPLERLPERALRLLLHTWDHPDQGSSLQVMLRSATHDPAVARLVREVIERGIVDRIAAHVGGRDARKRAGLFATQATGVIFSRYILELEPIASMPADELVRRLAPGMRAVLLPRTSAAG